MFDSIAFCFTKGRGKSRDSLNQAIDDLLGGDDGELIIFIAICT